MVKLIILATTAIGTGVGALIGAAAQSTEKGKKLNSELEHDWDKYGKDVKELAGVAGRKMLK